MAPKQMNVIEQTDNKITLRGYGVDRFGTPFDDYGLTVYTNGSSIDKIILNLHDRGIDIEYLS